MFDKIFLHGLSVCVIVNSGDSSWKGREAHMIVLDVVVNGVRVDTVKPVNQRPREMYWMMVDLLHSLQAQYGDNVTLHRRVEYYL